MALHRHYPHATPALLAPAPKPAACSDCECEAAGAAPKGFVAAAPQASLPIISCRREGQWSGPGPGPGSGLGLGLGLGSGLGLGIGLKEIVSLQARGGAALREGGVVQAGEPGEGDLVRVRGWG